MSLNKKLIIPVPEFTIPEMWKNHISYSFRRVYIGPAIGCPINCAYCFIFDYGLSRIPQIITCSGKEILTWLKSQEGFVQGKNGTLISIAPTTEPFITSEIAKKTLEIICEVAKLGNPIQISTKLIIEKEMLNKLNSYQINSGQITLYFSITTLKYWKIIEPGSDSPLERINNLIYAKKVGLNTCLYIKPAIPGIIEDDIVNLSHIIANENINLVVIGTMYSNSRIYSEFKKRNLLPSVTKEYFNSTGLVPPPPHTFSSNKKALQIDNIESINLLISKFSDLANSTYLINGPCAVANSYNILCPTGIWLYRPELCTNCINNCAQKFNLSEDEIKSYFPKINPLPIN